MFRILIILSFILTSPQMASTQTRPVSFEELDGLQAIQPRPVAILIMTGWCKYCHAMKNSMFKNMEISALLAGKYYVVLLDAEEKRDIVFSGQRFKFKHSGVNNGLHELAAELGLIRGQIAYPSLCFLNSKNEIIYQHEGFLGPASLIVLLKKLSSDK